MYIGTYNPPRNNHELNGAYIYKSENGIDWNQLVGPDGYMKGGFNDPVNVGIRTGAVLNDVIYFGTATFAYRIGHQHGCEVWRMTE